jgi:hypothetical protein
MITDKAQIPGNAQQFLVDFSSLQQVEKMQPEKYSSNHFELYSV